MSYHTIIKSFSLRPYKRVCLVLDPFHVGNAAGRHFLKECYTVKDHPERGNPDCQLTHKIVNDRLPPRLQLDLCDDSKLEIDTSQLNFNQLAEYLHWHTMGPHAVHAEFDDRFQSYIKTTENWEEFQQQRLARKEAWYAKKAAEAEAEERLKLAMAQKKAKRAAAMSRFRGSSRQ